MDPYIYQYIVGGLVFALGLYYGAKQGYVGFSGSGRRNLILVLGGLFCFAAVQGWLQYAPMIELEPKVYDGPALEKKEILGQPIDYAIIIGYFLAMLAIGTWFGRGQTSTKDFFFGGQRFAWWMISFSLVATTIGSYSFVKYSKIAYSYGIASSQTYLNDWFWIPFLLFGWLPILYFSRVVSIPEYFERRFGRTERQVSTVILLIYLIGYVGINLYTMGQALHILLGIPIFTSAAVVAAVSATYVTFGGQTSVIMTDLFQGFMLLATGLLLLYLGIDYLGGIDVFWGNLPRSHRMAFPEFNSDPAYPAVGIFWQDAMANSAMFYFLNQGMVMRLMAARSIDDSRKAVMTMLLILMPIAALVVASGGWVGRALVHAGALPDLPPKEAFFITAEFLSQPGIFGLIMAALTAALMSTVDTLVTAISAIVVNDVYKPLRPHATDKQLLKIARISALSVSVVGVGLVPVFAGFSSIYAAHGAFTAAITPPLVIALLFGVFWKRYTPKAALFTMVGGMMIIFLSIMFPEIITPFAHGVPMKDVSQDFLAGKDQYKFMRGFFGLVVCSIIGITVTLMTKPSDKDLKGLVWGTIPDAIRHYKGSDGDESQSAWAFSKAIPLQDEPTDDDRLPWVEVSPKLATVLDVNEKDMVYISDKRWWLGGLRSGHALVKNINPELLEYTVSIESHLHQILMKGGRKGTTLEVAIKRMY